MHKAVGNTLAAILMLLLSGPLAADLDAVAVLIEAGSHQAALDMLATQSESRNSRLLRARALAGLKRSDEAEALYRSLIDEVPQDPTPYNNLATLYAAAGRLQEASELLTRAMKSDARYAAIYKNLSRVYVEMSRNSYAKALRLSEEHNGLQLLSLDHRDAPAMQLAVATPLPVVAPVIVAAAAPVKVPVERQPPVAAAPMLDAGDGIAALNKWAEAWSAQDVEAYLSAYDVDFMPPRGLSLAQWQAERRIRLKTPSRIEVTLGDYEVSTGGGNALIVKALQRYRSDQYRDSTRKGFVIVWRDGVWKIGDEYTIDVVN